MRCKNCGSKNDDNLYICQNCGSPLYDEEENQEFTRVAEPIKTERKAPASEAERVDNKNKKLTVVIIVLCVVLLALVGGIIAIIANTNNKREEQTTLPVETTLADEYENTTKTTTETTTESTTQTTTQATTESTTEAKKTYFVRLSSTNGGEVEGDGEYQQGERVIIIARPDEENGYEFDGWYQGGTRISQSTTYRFNIDANIKLQAKFVQKDIPEDVTEDTENTEQDA